jgi:hypothetical protein
LATTKSTDPGAEKFGDASVELDAIPPDDLRALVRETIERHITATRSSASADKRSARLQRSNATSRHDFDGTDAEL